MARDAAVAFLLFGVTVFLALLAMRDFRAAGARSYFYQSNFEPAVTMACGRGFGVPQPSPASLIDFLQERRDDFPCGDLDGSTVQPLTEAAHANWYYLYGATAAVWRITGVSWTAIDYLDALLAASMTVIVYGLFRLVTGPMVGVLLTLLLTLSPANLTQLLSVRDYSKGPFVLAAVFLLAWLVMRPMSRMATIGCAAAVGVVVGVGYGFRGDLAVLVPFGAAVSAFLLPGALRQHAARNAAAALALVAAFVIVALPVIRALDKGGCTFHVALLGLTTPLTGELALTPPLYRFGDSLTDTFAILKTGDFTTRILHEPVPAYCDAQYDRASGQLYMTMASVFPADFVVRAYGSVLSILRGGIEIPGLVQPVQPLASTPLPGLYALFHAVTSALSATGPLVTIAAIGVAFASSWRHGLALSLFVLFLAGYPAIQFEGRHWFHLRFLPWWAGALVIREWMRSRTAGWEWSRMVAGAGAAGGLVVAMALALVTIRVVQERSAERVFAQYEAASIAPLPALASSTGMDVAWEPRLVGIPQDLRGTDLVVATLDAAACAGEGPLTLTVKYAAASPALDLTTDIRVPRPALDASSPTRTYVPVFQSQSEGQVFQHFVGFQVAGAPPSCIQSVGRVTNGDEWPLWLQVTLPPDWRSYPLYQSLRLPRPLRHLFRGEAE